ncbi:anthranilate phosphoribosyltransferase [Chloroflexota bacterium]
MIREAIAAVVSGRSLDSVEAAAVMRQIMEGEATPAQIAALVVAMRMKGETPEELAGFAETMLSHAVRIESDAELDTCGTGGDGSHTFNISTTAAFVAAGAGVRVAKHGNRAMSSMCGSADVLSELGVKLDLEPRAVERCIREVGIGFMFAPVFHPAMKHAAGPRREIGIRTMFNILGPLCNPAGARAQLLGVADETLVEKMATVLQRLGFGRAMVVHGEDGLDELTLAGRSLVCELRDGRLQTYQIVPEDYGLPRATAEDLAGGTVEENAKMLRDVLSGSTGPRRHIVLLNAGASLYVAGAAESIRDGLALAADSIDSGRALAKLRELVDFCRNTEGVAA